MPAMLDDIGWFECKKRRFISMIKYWNQLIRTNSKNFKDFLYDYDIKLNKIR